VLPADVRRARNSFALAGIGLVGIAAPLIVVSLILTVQGHMDAVRVISRVNLVVAISSAALFLSGSWPTRYWKARYGLSDDFATRLMTTSSWNAKFWRRPELARVFAREAAVASTAPSSPEALVQAIAESASALPEPLQVAGRQAESAARDVMTFIAAVDREIETLSRDADPAERARLQQKLAAFETQASAGQPRSRMHDLLREQIDLLDSLDLRRRQLLDDRERSVELLRSLHLQLARSRARLAQDVLSAGDLSAQIRAICAELVDHRVAASEVDAMMTSARQP
jgi:hypothetical protein